MTAFVATRAETQNGSGEARLIALDPGKMARSFPAEPFAYRHFLAAHPLLQLDALAQLAAGMPRDRLEYNSGRLKVDQKPEETPGVDLEPTEIVRQIETAGAWMVLKNVETIPEYGRVVEAVLDEAARASGHRDRRSAGMTEPMGFIFVSSAHAVTPFHLDYEENLFVQLHGDKAMHVFDNRDRSIIDEEGLETFPGKHRNHRFRDHYASREQVFAFKAGDGMFLPYTWPHWVETGDDWSISMAITWKTPEGRRLNKLYFANAVLRRLGIPQAPPGQRRWLDGVKVALYDIARLPLEPLRRGEAMRRMLRTALFGRAANYYYGKAGKT
ncbi:Cupin-like domain-containing protein [Kaistia soli DSM 19436]|uniref:Cupin-like domain-containing protein n=1 Tax=Kaistia soli DSM 19436 TaxID=1122133 RepID=A0A1M5C894_9HYPH|nr:cupin-like domain-containing protein [Kaistia soli]SHF50968.1 Cupin-like domain-containing protein [Kaistia soli DSM 19436]